MKGDWSIRHTVSGWDVEKMNNDCPVCEGAPLTEGERRHAIKPMSKSRPIKSPPAPTTDETTVEILDYITARVPLTNTEILTIIGIIK